MRGQLHAAFADFARLVPEVDVVDAVIARMQATSDLVRSLAK